MKLLCREFDRRRHSPLARFRGCRRTCTRPFAAANPPGPQSPWSSGGLVVSGNKQKTRYQLQEKAMIRVSRRAFLHGSAALAAMTTTLAAPRFARAADPIKTAAIY